MILQIPKKVEIEILKFSPVKFYFTFTQKKSRGKTLVGVRESFGQKMLSPDRADSNAWQVQK